jgi:hypothetical protein
MSFKKARKQIVFYCMDHLAAHLSFIGFRITKLLILTEKKKKEQKLIEKLESCFFLSFLSVCSSHLLCFVRFLHSKQQSLPTQCSIIMFTLRPLQTATQFHEPRCLAYIPEAQPSCNVLLYNTTFTFYTNVFIHISLLSSLYTSWRESLVIWLEGSSYRQTTLAGRDNGDYVTNINLHCFMLFARRSWCKKWFNYNKVSWSVVSSSVTTI